MPTKDSILIGQILIDEGIVTSEQLEIGLKEQKRTGDFICTVLVKLGFAPEEKIFGVLSRQLKIPYVKLKTVDIEPLIIQKVPAKFASHYKIIPLEFKDNNLVIATTDPLDIRTLDDIRLLLGLEVKGVLASELEIQEAIRKYYGVGAETLERIIAEKPASEELKMQTEHVEDLEILAEDASIIKFVNQVLSEAIKDRATDIHLEPFLVSSSLECLIAQRLVRLICQKCKKPVKSKKEILGQIKDIEFDPEEIELYEGAGCQDCRFTGYRGRTGIYEILVITEPVRELILQRASSQQIKQKAVLQGMRTLRYDGLQKVLKGLTTFAEVMRVTQQEALP